MPNSDSKPALTLHYRAFGISIASNVVLPSFQQEDASTIPDVAVTFAVDSGAGACVSSDAPLTTAACSPAKTLLAAHWHGHHVRYVVTDGFRQVRAFYWPHDELENAATYFCGPVLRSLLACRGHFGLHAGGVASAGSAVLVVGSQGAGKSTLLAALSQLGGDVFADDFAVLENVGDEWLAHTGERDVKLTSESLEANGLQRNARTRAQWHFADVARISMEPPKVVVSMSRAPVAATRPLTGIFLLTKRSGSETRVTRLKAPEALARLAPHVSALPEGLAHVRDARVTAATLARLVSTVRVYAVSQPHDLSMLPRTARAVLHAAVGCAAL